MNDYPFYDPRFNINNFSVRKNENESVLLSPKSIYKFLDGPNGIYGQSELKEYISILLWGITHTSRHFPSQNALIISPSGTGKTEIFRCIKNNLFDNINIFSAANCTPEGYKGTSVTESLRGLDPTRPAIVVLDEIDKLFLDSNWNKGEQVTSTLLRMMEDDEIILTSENNKEPSEKFNCQNISFIFLGTFSCIKPEEKTPIGFSFELPTSDETKITKQTLLESKLLSNEFLGRLTRIIVADSLSEDDYRQILDKYTIRKIASDYGVIIDLKEETRKRLIDNCKDFGVRGMASEIIENVNRQLFSNIDSTQITF